MLGILAFERETTKTVIRSPFPGNTLNVVLSEHLLFVKTIGSNLEIRSTIRGPKTVDRPPKANLQVTSDKFERMMERA